jgi:hypothetical protein
MATPDGMTAAEQGALPAKLAAGATVEQATVPAAKLAAGARAEQATVPPKPAGRQTAKPEAEAPQEGQERPVLVRFARPREPGPRSFRSTTSALPWSASAADPTSRR